MPAQACVFILSLYCYVHPHLLKSSVNGWPLDLTWYELHKSSQEFLLLPHHMGLRGLAASELRTCVTLLAVSFRRLTQRCRDGQGEDKTMSLSHRYIKEVAEAASLVGWLATAHRTVLSGFVFREVKSQMWEAGKQCYRSCCFFWGCVWVQGLCSSRIVINLWPGMHERSIVSSLKMRGLQGTR